MEHFYSEVAFILAPPVLTFFAWGVVKITKDGLYKSFDMNDYYIVKKLKDTVKP